MVGNCLMCWSWLSSGFTPDKKIWTNKVYYIFVLFLLKWAIFDLILVVFSYESIIIYKLV